MGTDYGHRRSLRVPVLGILSLDGRDDVRRDVLRYMPARQRARLMWRNVRFAADMRGFELSFDKHKNAQYIQDNKVLGASSSLVVVCSVRLTMKLGIFTGGSEDLLVFLGFNGQMLAKSPRTAAPRPERIAY